MKTIQDITIQKSIKLSEQEALKVLIFMTGMEAERELKSAENLIENKQLQEA